LENAAPLRENPRFGFAAVDLTALSVVSGKWKVTSESQNDGSSLIPYPLPLTTDNCSLITSFATLHHIPSLDLRLNIFRFVRANLAPGGKFVLSNWQFLNSEKLKRRIQPWEAAGLSDADVDSGDFLLDWRSGGHGLRYAHHFSAEELSQMASDTGFRAVESFLSDGESGNLGLYQIWQAESEK
ncbi:MAG TPA: methyltransferase domain-containing protein, partial [Pseudomonadales bacterium]|nr:methyltransferase domain-containing protein [Pseudomonadales bacterium]